MRRFSRATKKKSTTILICVLVIGIAFGLAFFFSVRQIKNRYEAENLAIQNQLDSVQNMVYVATKDIPAGGVIDQDSVSKTAISTSIDTSLYITDDDLGKIAVVNISQGQSVFSNMVGTDYAAYLRECEYALITLNSNLKKNDLIDVRIMYTNGENYTILSKKCIKGINFDTNEIYLWNGEKDIMLMSAAIVDTYMNEGAIIYTTKYIEDGQKATTVNYQPSSDVMAAMANDPNLLTEATNSLNASMRESIESRLNNGKSDENSTKKDVKLTGTITSGNGTSDPEATSGSSADDSSMNNTDSSDTSSESSGNTDSSDTLGNDSSNTDNGENTYSDKSTGSYEDEGNKMNEDGGSHYEY